VHRQMAKAYAQLIADGKTATIQRNAVLIAAA